MKYEETKYGAMKYGAIFPQYEVPTDATSLLCWIQGVEELGYDHVVMYDHVLGVDRVRTPEWAGVYDVEHTFHEPMVSFGYLAGRTRLELATGILVLPQREMALVAKQAAELDLLSEGRFRLGVGAGWNRPEMEALGGDFGTRGRRMEDQIVLMRRLWSEQSLTVESSYHRLNGVGMAPRPARPVPIWLGGSSDAALRRIGRVGDGWFAPQAPQDVLERARSVIAHSAEQAGRIGAEVGIEARINATPAALDHVVAEHDMLRRFGASHVSVVTLHGGMRGVEAHLDLLGRAAELLGLTHRSVGAASQGGGS